MERLVTPEGIEVICLQDGATEFAPEVFPGLADERRLALMAAAGVDQVRARFNVYLLRGPGVGVTLVDCGAGALFGPEAGQMAGLLAGLGVSAAEVTRLVFTHLHADHCGGALTAGGAAVFAHAQVVMQAEEAAAWRGKDAPGGRLVAASAGRLRLVEGAEDLGGGLVCWPLPGHTPGHMGLRLGATVALWGDAVHAEDLQFQVPEIATCYDEDVARARESRLAALRLVAAQGLVVGGAHLMAGFGRISAAGAGYVRADRVARA
jgi:glyoxylase-like metal-dependent hydrolase (beta-lactamase superfamily II)